MLQSALADLFVSETPEDPMRDVVSIENILQRAKVEPLPKEAVWAYQNAELLRRRPPIWRALARLHPSLPWLMEIVAFAVMFAGIALIFCALPDAHDKVPPNSGHTIKIISLLTGLGFCYFAYKCYRQYEAAKFLQWEYMSLPEYQKLHGRMPERAYELIAAIRKVSGVTNGSVFQLKVIGDDPILNFGRGREEFDERENYDILIWGPGGNIVDLT